MLNIMKYKSKDDLKKNLQAFIDEGLLAKKSRPQKYWYPLSCATYEIEEIMEAVESLCMFITTMGDKTLRFEKTFSEKFNHSESIFVNSGSSADLLIAFALVNPAANLLEPGDEILAPSVTWPTQIWSPMMAGLKVRLVDTDPFTLNMDIKDLEIKIGPRTRAISLVHLMGNPCEMDKITEICQKHDLVLVEDCCESLGAKYKGQSVGTFGIAGSYSFFFSHHITTMEGGMVGCRDKGLSDLFRLLRAHGWARNMKHTYIKPANGIDERYTFINWGFNLRPTELQAGFGLVQLGRQPEFHKQRKKNAEYFGSYLLKYKDIMRLMQVSDDAECSWFALPVMLTPECPFSKENFLKYLEKMGVETRPIVTGNIALQPVVNMFPSLKDDNLHGANMIHKSGFYLGLYPFDSTEQMDRLFEIFDSYLKDYIK
jgi:CDP-6-deoxy-D-xylo-4-hexulose-3-dehydrase